MAAIDNILTTDNKDYDNDVESCSYEHLIDIIFNDLMDSDSRYIYQAITKFQSFRIKSPNARIDIYKQDFADATKNQIRHYVKDCKTQEEAYHKLNGVFTEVIALIYKEAEHLILSSIEFEDKVWVKRAINEMRTAVSKKWRFV
jgi:hypothetical protein